MVKQSSIEQGIKNLKPLNTREDFKELSSKGGKASVKKRKELRHAKEILTDLLSTDLSKEQVKKILDNDSTVIGTRNAYDVLLEKAYKLGTEQDNIKAIQFVADYVGDKPKDEVKIDANIITDNDRKLLELLANKGKDAD